MGFCSTGHKKGRGTAGLSHARVLPAFATGRREDPVGGRAWEEPEEAEGTEEEGGRRAEGWGGRRLGENPAKLEKNAAPKGRKEEEDRTSGSYGTVLNSLTYI